MFFPTEKETFLGFVIQGPYRTTPARDNVPEDDDWNRALVSRTAILLGDVLTELRDQGQLAVDGLLALPLEADRFPPGSMFAPIFDAVRTLLVDGAFVPDSAGGYGAPARLRLSSRSRPVQPADTRAAGRTVRSRAGRSDSSPSR